MQTALFSSEHTASQSVMQDAYPLGVTQEHRPYRTNRQLWFAHYHDLLGPRALAERLDSVDTHITAIVKGRRNVGDELASKFESAFGLAVGTLDSTAPSSVGKQSVSEPNQRTSQSAGQVITAIPSLPMGTQLDNVLDLLAKSEHRDEAMHLLDWLLRTGAVEYRQRLHRLLLDEPAAGNSRAAA